MAFHQKNGGLSRYVKFRYFFEEVVGVDITEEEVNSWAMRFSEIMKKLSHVDEKGKVDFSSSQKTQNTRVSYPIYHIKNIVKPVSKGDHPKKIVLIRHLVSCHLSFITLATVNFIKQRFRCGY